MDIATTVFVVAIIIFSAIIHEVMHGVAADWLGDKTARYAGRLTLNPIPHLDPFGSIILPAILVLSGSPIFFGWAKPVPYNPYNLKPGRFSEAIVAGAGPASNAVIALLAALVIRLNIFPGAAEIIFLIVVVNVMLCIFNLIPMPPLDGSKVLEAFLPCSMHVGYDRWRHTMERSPIIGIVVVVLVVYVFGTAFSDFIYAVATALVGT